MPGQVSHFPSEHCSETFGSALIVATGCDNGERISRLEKQNQELQAEIKKRDAVAEYDLQAKCSKDARGWFKSRSASLRRTLQTGLGVNGQPTIYSRSVVGNVSSVCSKIRTLIF
jgi:ribosomal protein S13